MKPYTRLVLITLAAVCACVWVRVIAASVAATEPKPSKDARSARAVISNLWEPSPSGEVFAIAVQEEYGGPRSLSIVRLDDGKPLKLTEIPTTSWPAWSPDSNMVAFSQDGRATITPYMKNERLGIYSLSTRRISWLPCTYLDRAPVWDPDGRKLAFARLDFSDGLGKLAKCKVMVVDARGGVFGKFGVATAECSCVDTPAWSPDGKLIAFIGHHLKPSPYRSTWDVYVMRPDSGGATKLTASGDVMRYSLSWSPDSKSVAFATKFAPGNLDFKSLEVVTVADHKRRVMVRAADLGKRRSVSVGAIKWSPDGRHIIFDASQYSPAFGATYIGIIDWPSGKFRWLTNDGKSRAPRWSSDAKRVLYVQDGTVIWSVFPDGTKAVKVYSLTGSRTPTPCARHHKVVE